MGFNETNRNERRAIGSYTKEADDTFSILPRSTTYNSFYFNDYMTRRHTSGSFLSVRLSKGDLLQRKDKQMENSIKSLPENKESKRYDERKRTVQSASTPLFLKDMSIFFDSYYDRMHKQCSFDPFEDMDIFSTSLGERKEPEAIGNERQFLKKESEHESHNTGKQTMLFSNGLSQQEFCPAGRPNNETGRIKFGVRLEHMTLTNKLKVNVNRVGMFSNEAGQRKIKDLVAKISILPGKMRRQKVQVCDGEKTPSVKSSLYFRDISTPDLTDSEIGVGIYKKRGLFRRLRVIHEWKISMKDVDLKMPVTAWREVDCYV